ncbi:Mobile element protein [Candidatus Enterovibrio altilux]|uniref:Mobile element protein n=1 Tax=Candidatus Enterovibrio altilux TaxID=1927128 RepID=A0A291B794_9GAMM|nr:Mobile element protein [Candidatus Enterovibrio luxaltus]
MLLRGLQGFINSVFKLTKLSLSWLHYSCIYNWIQTVNATFKTRIKESSSI